MSKILRATLIQFGTGINAASEIGQFGSYASPDYSIDISVLQSGTAWGRGWYAETINTNRPFIQDFNAIDYVAFYFLCYLLQMGLAEYDAGTTYYTNSRCQYAGVSYRSLQDTNIGNTPGGASSLYWQATGDVLGANIASSSSIQPGSDGTIFQVTGTTGITSILNPNSVERLTLIFTGALTVTSNTNIALNNGDFVTVAGAILTLAWNGSNWVEVSRSPAPVPSGYAALQSKSFNTPYVAATDGEVIGWAVAPGGNYLSLDFYTASLHLLSFYGLGWQSGGSMSVAKGETWQVNVSGDSSATLYWRPLGV